MGYRAALCWTYDVPRVEISLMETLRVLKSLHGHCGVLATAALLHPAILLRHGRPLSRSLRIAIVLTTCLVLIAFGLGIGIYDDYRVYVKRRLFQLAPDAGYLFETKEHLAWAVLSLSFGAGVAALIAPRKEIRIRQVSALAYAIAALLCAFVSAIGIYVSSIYSFPAG